MMSQSEEETLLQIKQSAPSKICFANEAGTSTTPPLPATPLTTGTETTTVTSPSTDDLYADAFNFALPNIFLRTLMVSLTSKDAFLKEVRDCGLTDNEDRCRQISPYINSFWKDPHVKNGCVCINDRMDIPKFIKDALLKTIHATHLGSLG